MKYNLKVSVVCVIVALAVAPFVYFHYRAGDALDYFRSGYNFLDGIAACILTLPIFASIAFSPAFARFCARDPSRIAETILTARFVSCIITLILLFGVFTWIW